MICLSFEDTPFKIQSEKPLSTSNWKFPCRLCPPSLLNELYTQERVLFLWQLSVFFRFKLLIQTIRFPDGSWNERKKSKACKSSRKWERFPRPNGPGEAFFNSLQNSHKNRSVQCCMASHKEKLMRKMEHQCQHGRIIGNSTWNAWPRNSVKKRKANSFLLKSACSKTLLKSTCSNTYQKTNGSKTHKRPHFSEGTDH